MYNMITNLYNKIYDGNTGEFLGDVFFELSQEGEEKLLNLVNYGRVPESLILLNARIVGTPKDYKPPELIKAYTRKGILSAHFRDDASGEQVPIEIHWKFDVRGRGRRYEDLYHFDSAEYRNIAVDQINWISK
ncbi:MAG: hypothetical protein VB096_01500 [Pseudoflavonifractor sp.]|nr:hypothetical protein [Pseudoflavonifractor sp.]